MNECILVIFVYKLLAPALRYDAAFVRFRASLSEYIFLSIKLTVRCSPPHLSFKEIDCVIEMGNQIY